MSKASEFRDLSPEELEAILSDKRKELFETINKRAREKKIDNPGIIKTLRRDIARILTVQREKSLKVATSGKGVK